MKNELKSKIYHHLEEREKLVQKMREQREEKAKNFIKWFKCTLEEVAIAVHKLAAEEITNLCEQPAIHPDKVDYGEHSIKFKLLIPRKNIEFRLDKGKINTFSAGMHFNSEMCISWDELFKKVCRKGHIFFRTQTMKEFGIVPTQKSSDDADTCPQIACKYLSEYVFDLFKSEEESTGACVISRTDNDTYAVLIGRNFEGLNVHIQFHVANPVLDPDVKVYGYD